LKYEGASITRSTPLFFVFANRASAASYMPQRPIPHWGLPQLPPDGIVGKLIAAPPATWPETTLSSFVSFGLSHSEHFGFSSEFRTTVR
jgi:integral membrane sensor domain MASE1